MIRDTHASLVIVASIFSQVMHLTKMTAAILDDLEYIVDPSAVSSEASGAQRW